MRCRHDYTGDAIGVRMSWFDLHDPTWLGLLLLAIDFVIRVGLSFRIIMRRLPESTALAWLGVVLAFPVAGIILYLLFGELRLGRWRLKRARRIVQLMRPWRDELKQAHPLDPGQPFTGHEIARSASITLDAVPIAGNRVELLRDGASAIPRLLADIEAAQLYCHLEFYIWSEGGFVAEVEAALMRAVARGVKCRVLVDAVGSKSFLKSKRVEHLRRAGVEVRVALPAGFIRAVFARIDLRLHRKIVVIDDAIGYTGSLNMADPRYFKKEANVGAWVDALMRIEGPAVEPLSMTFLADWAQEGKEIPPSRKVIVPAPPCGDCRVQVIPSGPTMTARQLERLLITAIFSAQRELILTTPYFVPNAALLGALLCAVDRGVDVTLIVPTRIDSKLVRFASRAFQGDLQEAGVKIRLFDAGLLHTKSITIDGQVSLFGSVNLDMRSFMLNFEITLAVYDAPATEALRQLQQHYIKDSHPLDLTEWHKRGVRARLIENIARLVGPLL